MDDKELRTTHDEHLGGATADVGGDVLREKTVAVENVDLSEAIKDLTPWGKGYLKVYGCLALVALASTMNGFDGSLMGSINALPSYTNYYGLPKEGSTSTGIVFAIFNVGQMAGALFMWIADWVGRKNTIFIGCVGVVVGAIITATSPTLGGFIGGRFFLSFFSTIATTAAALFLIEISPLQYRGTISGLYNTLYYLGSIVASCTLYGTYYSSFAGTLLQWRLALWLQCVLPGLVCFGIFFLPESPRWLIGKGRVAEARAMIATYHANGDADHPIVALQMNEMETSIREQGGMATWSTMFDLRDLFKNRNRRYRLMLNIAFSWMGQFSGNNVASYYLPDLVANVGITSVGTQLLMNVIYAIIGWIFAITGAFLHDRFGRRVMFLASTGGMAIALAITAGTAAEFVETGSKASSSASIAFIFIFGAIFAIGFTSMQPIYPGEVMTNDMRAKGMGVLQLTGGCAGFVNTFAAPVTLAKIGYWFYVFFVFWDVLEFLFVYFFFVETKGRTLEELDELFDSPNPRKASTKKTVVRKLVVVDSHGDKHAEVVQV